MKRKSFRIASSGSTLHSFPSASAPVDSSKVLTVVENPKLPSWCHLGSDRKKTDDAHESSSSSILSYYQGLALSLHTSLSSTKFFASLEPSSKWENTVQKDDYGPVYIVSRDTYGYYDDNDQDVNTFYWHDDDTSHYDPICKVFIGSDLLIEACILNVRLSDLRKV